MSLLPPERTRRIVFVCRDPIGESLRNARGITKLDRLSLLGICEQPTSTAGTGIFADLICVEDAHDANQLIEAARRLTAKHGALDRIVTSQETLLEPAARANEALGLHGMRVSTVRRALNKSCLKSTLQQAGIRTAHDKVIAGRNDAEAFVNEVGFPIVLKPLNGSGGLATWCIRTAEQLDLALKLMKPSFESAILAEDFLCGEELCIDTITVADEPLFYSICCYRPSILEALEDPQIQWSCLMPRDINSDRYRAFIEQGLRAVRALKVGNAMTHMEGFLLNDGGVSFTDATLRPAGARIGPMLAFAYDIDPYFAWARVAVDGLYDGPWERKYAVGTVFLRGIGAGLVAQVDGVESMKEGAGELIVEARLPRVGAVKSATYTGDGYITVRHPETRVVEDALTSIKQTVQITYTEPESTVANRVSAEQWGKRLQYFDKQLNRPAWDNDALPGRNEA